MEESKNNTRIYQKLLAIQTELKAPKSQFNNFGKYNYRNVEDILEAVKPLCAKHQALIYLSERPEFIQGRFYIQAEAWFVDVESCEQFSVTAYAREDDAKKGMDGAQITGASSSYARKYALAGLLAVDDGKDSDSANNGDPPPQNPTVPSPSPDSQTIFCEICKKSIVKTRMKDGKMCSPEGIASFSRKRYGKTLCADCMRAVDGQ